MSHVHKHFYELHAAQQGETQIRWDLPGSLVLILVPNTHAHNMEKSKSSRHLGKSPGTYFSMYPSVSEFTPLNIIYVQT